MLIVFSALLALICSVASANEIPPTILAGLGWVAPHSAPAGASTNVATVSITPGTATPQSEDNAHPSMSRWNPSCLDATWGVGCNVSTQTCIAPSVGTPDERCQPPLQFVVDPTRSSSASGTVTIGYISTASFTFPTGSPLIVSGALASGWNTQTARVTSATLGTGAPCPGSDECVTLGFSPSLSPSLVTTLPAYVGGIAGNQNSEAGFSWNACTVTAASYSSPNVTATFTGSCVFPTGSTIHTTNFSTSPTSVWNLATATVVSSTTNSVTFAAPSASYVGSGIIYDMSYALTGPNGQWTPVSSSPSTISYDVNTPYPTGYGGTLGALNGNGYNGTVIQPWVVTASACGDLGDPTKCHVSFLNAAVCSASCVNAATQIVAGQFNDPIVAWDTGPIAPMAVEGTSVSLYPSHLVTKCVDAMSLSHGGSSAAPIPMQFVAFAVDGGPFAKATLPQLDPWGVGANPLSDKINHTQVYCGQFDASAVADGEHEMRAIACPVAGPCTALTSTITAEGATGSSTFSSRAHMLADTYRLGITNTVDPAFNLFNGGLQATAATIAVTGSAWHNDAPTCGSGNCVVYSFSQPSTMPNIPKGTLVNLTGQVVSNSCAISGYSGTGATDTFTYTGGCNFPVGSQISIAGVTPTAVAVTSTACLYTSGSGDVAITLPSAAWGAAPLANIQYKIAGITGTNASSINGEQPLASSAGAGTILHFTVATGLTISNCTGGGGPTVTSNAYAVNSFATTNAGAQFAAETSPYVTATDGSSFVTIPGMSTGTASAGTIAANWNGHCVTINAAAAGTITCAQPNQASSTTSTLGSIQVNANLYCAVGGAGDNQPPFNPNFTGDVTMTGDAFQIIPFLSDTCDNQGNHVGCQLEPCGIPASMNSTIWFVRNDAGTHELLNSANQRGAAFMNNGSMFIYTNVHGGITTQDAYVDSWNPSAVASGCVGPPRSAADWNAAGPTYSGAYCTSITAAVRGLVGLGSLAPSETAGNAGGCTTFTASANSSLLVGQTIVWKGLDKGVAGDGSNGLFQNGDYYWIASVTGTAVTLTTTPAGACINETAALLASVTFTQNISFDNIYLKCDTAFGCSGNATNPQKVNIRASATSNPYYALAGWLNILADTTNGTPLHSVVFISGGVDAWQSSGGRIHTNVDLNSPSAGVTVIPVNSIGPIPGATSGYGVITVTGGSLSGSCPGSACTETLTYTVADTPGGGHYTSAHFQNPTATAPGQGLVIQNVTGSSGTWTCGTLTAPCAVTTASAGTVSFINPAAAGIFSSAGSQPIVPVNLYVELAPGTMGGSWNGGQQDCANPSTNQSFNFSLLTPVPVMCFAGAVNAPGAIGTSNAFSVFYGKSIVAFSNCIITENAGWIYNYNVSIAAVTPSNGTTNDLITLTTGSLGSPLFAYNACGTDGFTFTNQTIQGTGIDDAWADSLNVVGPSYSPPLSGHLTFNSLGIVYDTNMYASDTTTTFDTTGYAWGDASVYNEGGCHNSGGISFHVRCLSSHDAIPAGPPLWGWVAQQPPLILHTYDTYAHYLAGTPEITCSGTPCVAGNGAGDGGTTSHFYVLQQYGVPRFSVESWENFVLCNLYPAGIAGGGLATATTMINNTINQWQTTNLDGAGAAVELTATAGSTTTCPDGPSGNASLSWFPVTHGDTNFWLVNQLAGSPAELRPTGNASVVKDVVIDDQDTTNTGNAEGIFNKGPSLFMNIAINHTTSSANQYPAGWTSIKAFAMDNDFENFLLMNSNIYGNNFYAPDYLARTLGTAFPTAVTETYEINDQLVPVGQTNPNNGFPYALTIDPDHSGPQTMWDSFWNPGPNVDNLCWPAPSGSGSVCGGIQNFVMWPSEARQVNQNTGVTLVAGPPNSLSLRALPWYGPTGDSGGGLY